MRFRLLSNEELTHLEEEFKQFLIINHIHADEWKMLNANEPQKAIALVELFSDTVLLKVYGKIEYLEFRSKHLFSVYRVLPEKIQAIHLKSESETVSLAHDDEISNAVNETPLNLSIYRAEKMVQPFKEDEVHRLIEQGCMKSTELVWEQFSNLIKSSA